MKNLLVILFATMPAVAAAEGMYFCETKAAYEVSAKGTLEQPKNTLYKNERFTVNRTTGEIAGGGLTTFNSNEVAVNHHGDSENSFIAIINQKPKSHWVTVIQVKEYAEGSNKPFLVYDMLTLRSGICRKNF